MNDTHSEFSYDPLKIEPSVTRNIGVATSIIEEGITSGGRK